MHFSNAKMKQGEKVIDCVNRVKKLWMDYNMTGGDMLEDSLVAKIVGSLPSDYHHFMTTWANMLDVAQSLAQLMPRLINEENIIQVLPKRIQWHSSLSVVITLVDEVEVEGGRRANQDNRQASSP